MIVNTMPRIRLVPDEAIDAIHRASLRILAEVGMAIICDEALDVLEGLAGARVDRDAHRVYFDPTAVEAAIAQLPSTITLYGRNPARTVTYGGNHVAFRPVGGCPFTMDDDRGRRTGRLEDLVELISLSQAIDEIDLISSGIVAPQDVPVPLRPAVTRYVTVKYSDKPGNWGMLAPTPGDIDRDIRGDFRAVVEALYGADWDYVAKPVTFSMVNPISPLCLDDRMAGSLMNHAYFGQPIEIMSAAIAGMTAPMTLAGAMAQQNAEILGSIMLCHAVRPGTPVTYGTLVTIGDMKVGGPAYGSVEYALCVGIGAQLAARYGIPSHTGGCLTDSKLPDAQAGYERMFTLLLSFLTGTHEICHAAGHLESYMTSSYELLAIDAELIGMLERLVRGVTIDDEQIAYEVIKEVGPQGLFLTTEHTYRTFRGSYFEPRLSDRLMYNDWLKRGAKSVVQRANERWKELLRSYQAPPLDPHAEQLLIDLIRRDESAIPPAEREEWPRQLVRLGGAATASRM